MKIIAEIGTAHRGSLSKAEQLIREAARCGADTAKFQIVFAREILHPLTGSVPLPGGATPLFEVFKALEQDLSFYQALKEITESENLEFLATPFGLESASLLKSLQPDSVKIASPELNYTDLLMEVASWKLPVILSSGVCELDDIKEAVGFFSKDQLTLLHCVTAYPAPEEDYNLSLLPVLRQQLDLPIGVSDHSMHPSLVPCVASSYGAVMIEKHFTLSREEDGLDDPIALEPEDFKQMAGRLHDLEYLSSAEDVRKQLNKWFSPQEILAVSGSGIKELAPSEAPNYGRTNRSIHALTDLKAGTVLTEENSCVVRTEKVLTPGMHPRYYREILGRRVVRDISSGEGILKTDITPSP
ncbi:spore coat protein [Oceanispirochaeta crateris]|uniref:Spore coat protein n=1 Tax=Oceanispirochaeta crateris TaxID=2518645 RepID=A0A5C1QLP7_9SPIO|nr:N-acetylneuraminate synthase family protein [Oceanispirochaeta crateris]QEN08417.1 spore coat protein [Oceanispirochaeta crateris]